MSRLSSAQLDRAIGVLLGSAAGDALGAPYEFHPPRGGDQTVGMVGGGPFGWEPGEWTDDTSMALVIAEVAATGVDLAGEQAQDEIARLWYSWAQKAPDVGAQTRGVLTSGYYAAAEELTFVRARHLRAAAIEHHRRSGRSGGNGSLMRTAPVALAYLHDEDQLFEVAMALSRLTHHDAEAAEACALWCLAVRHAVLTGSLNIRRGLVRLSTERREVWLRRIEVAERSWPADFAENGWVVEAFQSAWSAIVRAGVADATSLPADGTSLPAEGGSEPTAVVGGEPPALVGGTPHRARQLERGIELAARAGNDSDTIAAIAGGLLGAAFGGSAVPAEWRRLLHGWPGMRARDLTRLAVLITRDGDASPNHWPNLPRVDYAAYGDTSRIVPLADDARVLVGGVGGLTALPFGVDAVVSLCRLGSAEVPANLIAVEDHVEMWVIDSPARVENPNLDYVLDDAVRVLLGLRAEGKTVFVHGVTDRGWVSEVVRRYAAALATAGPLAPAFDVAS